jgi:hypothetical protein
LTVTTGSQRFVDVTPHGVLAWISRPQRSTERDLIEHLLWRSPEDSLDLRMLAHEMELSVQDMTRTLFALNRQNGLVVRTGPTPARPVQGFQSGLLDDLRDLTETAGQAVLTTREGLCLAEAGCDPQRSPAVADVLAKAREILPSVTLYFALEHVTLLADHAVNTASTTWVTLARRLIHVCGALSFGNPSR